ncbi:MAG: TolC family protein [Campylobacterota bacterium]|nr:TolC family protein [Campylobacterota bacterium]
MMQFKTLLKAASFIVLCTSMLSANEEILSKQRLDLLDLNKQQIEQNSEKLSKDWINPITYKYIRSFGEQYDTAKSMVTINQPIFRSGGIYQAIKYSSALEKYQYIDLETSRKALIKEATSFLYQIHKMNNTIEKQALLIKNSQIDIERKKEQVFNGLIDTSFLDNAILDANIKKNALLDLQFQQKSLIHNFNSLSQTQYDKLELPRFDMLSKDQFIQNNIYIQKTRANIESKKWLSSMTVSKYLPTISFTYDYSKYHNTDNNPALMNEHNDTYGVNLTIPFDVRTFNDIKSSKIEKLKAQKSLEIEKTEQENFMKIKLAKLDVLNKKVKIAQDDVKLYDSLLKQMDELLEAGLKTQSDVDTMENSLNIKYLDIKILDIEAQMELLELYSRLK